MKLRQSAASPAAPAASTHDVVAERLAAMQRKSVNAATAALCVVAGAGYGWYALDNPAPLLALVFVPGLVAYARALWRDLDAERRRIYRLEVERNEDLTGDGVVGDPFGRVPVKREGKTVAEVIVPNPSGSARHEPIMEGGWGVSKSDLVAFVFEAERSRGLKEVAWVGEGVERFILPSGRAVTQALYREVRDALADHELDGEPMAAKEAQRWVLKAKAEAIALSMQP